MCAAGHVLHGGRVLAGWQPCGCPGATNGGHRTYTCLACVEAGRGAEATLYQGRHIPAGDQQQYGPRLR